MGIPVSFDVTQTGVGTTDWLPLNRWGSAMTLVSAEVTGTATYSVEATTTNILRGTTSTPAEATALEGFNALTATATGTQNVLYRALRLNVTSGTGSVRLRIQSGVTVPDAVTLFTPLSLFSSGEQGAWYDPSDLTALYQDSAGTTPVTADGQPVGLMLDRHEGLVLGPELFNGDFSQVTQTEDGWTIAADRLSCDGVDSKEFALFQNLLSTVNGYYEIELTIENYVSGSLFVSVTNGAKDSEALSSNGTFKFRAYDTNDDPNNFALYLLSEFFNGEITYLSCKQVMGNHASQSTAAAKPLNRDASPLQEYDGVDDAMPVTLPAIAAATIARATTTGAVVQYPVDLSTGSYTITESHSGIIILDRELTASETESVTTYLNEKAGV